MMFSINASRNRIADLLEELFLRFTACAALLGFVGFAGNQIPLAVAFVMGQNVPLRKLAVGIADSLGPSFYSMLLCDVLINSVLLCGPTNLSVESLHTVKRMFQYWMELMMLAPSWEWKRGNDWIKDSWQNIMALRTRNLIPSLFGTKTTD
jgi:hypothetical protein